MALDDIKKARLEKLEALKEKGINPYPAHTKRDHAIADVVQQFDALSQDATPVIIAGRVMALREHGSTLFVDINDGTGKIQGYITTEDLRDDSFSLFEQTVDIGDFIELAGSVFATKRGEQSIKPTSWTMLTKSLLPLPEKWHGLKDTEERLRKRYLDILVNAETRDLVEKRSRFWQVMRDFMIHRGFLEVETPVLETTPGGADARPFTTHHHALDMEVSLRISAGELWQKELMVAGFPKVFEIGRIFRNEGMSHEHLQDYTQMEFYWAYADFNDGMKLVEELYKEIADKVFGARTFTIGEHTIDLDDTWEHIDYASKIQELTEVDIFHTDENALRDKLAELKVQFDADGFNVVRGIDSLWKYCRKHISGPAFLINVPVFLEPLAKRSENNDQIVERFQVLLAGSEVGKGYSELNDPIDQRARFEEQQALRDAGDPEAHRMDREYVEALEYGMPPTCGFGVSERLFSFLANKPAREAQIFPLMRPKN